MKNRVEFLKRQLLYAQAKHDRFTASDDRGMCYEHDIKPLEDIISFIDQVYEIAFGDDAINKNYSSEEVLQKLQDFSDDALTYENNYKFKNF